MDYFVGLALALVVGLLGTTVGFDKERSFYSTILMVVASYYLLFAAMTGAGRTVAIESVPFVAFAAIAIWGFRRWPTLVAIGLVAHGGFDLVHGRFIANPGVPQWWPGFCMAFDVTAGAYCLQLQARREVPPPRREA